MKCVYDSKIECPEEEQSFEKCRKCSFYLAIIEGAKGCGSIEF